MASVKTIATTLAATALLLTGCSSGADVASRNLSEAADNFEIERRITFINGITDKYLLTVEGKCSISDAEGQLEVTCKVGENDYRKHFLGLSDNVTYVAEQIQPADVSEYHYVVRYRPETLVPDMELDTSNQ